MKTLTIITRKWREKSKGTTHNLSRVIIDGKWVFTCESAFGLDWNHKCFDELIARGLADATTAFSLPEFCENKAISYYHEEIWVARNEYLLGKDEAIYKEALDEEG